MSDFNKCSIKDIVVEDALLDWDDIKIDGYDKKVNNRPIRPAHIAKLIASPQHKSFDNKPIVMQDEKNKTFSIIDGQHAHATLMELVKSGVREKPKKVLCSIAFRKSTKKIMSVNNTEDALVAIKHGYGRNAGNEKPSYCDGVYIVHLEMESIKEKLGISNKPNQLELKQMYDELVKVEFGYRKYSRDALKTFYRLGNSLIKADAMEESQRGRWNYRQVLNFIKTGEKPDPNKDLYGDKDEKMPVIALDEEDFSPEKREVIMLNFKDSYFRKMVIDKIEEVSDDYNKDVRR